VWQLTAERGQGPAPSPHFSQYLPAAGNVSTTTCLQLRTGSAPPRLNLQGVSSWGQRWGSASHASLQKRGSAWSSSGDRGGMGQQPFLVGCQPGCE